MRYETVDRVGSRIWDTKSDLLSRKIVCGVIKGWTLNDRCNLEVQLKWRRRGRKRFEDFRQGEHTKHYICNFIYHTLMIYTRKYNREWGRKKTDASTPRCTPMPYILNHLSLLSQLYQLRQRLILKYRVLIQGRPVLFPGVTVDAGRLAIYKERWSVE